MCDCVDNLPNVTAVLMLQSVIEGFEEHVSNTV